MATTPPRRRPSAVLGCLTYAVLVAAAGALAVGGSFWGWVVLGALVISGAIVLLVVLVRRNKQIRTGDRL